jgi:hypothetical protein
VERSLVFPDPKCEEDEACGRRLSAQEADSELPFIGSWP